MITRTPISYYGGKQALLNHILPKIPKHNVYTEVFFGGGAVFFAKPESHNETINDKLDIVVNFYQCVVTDFDRLKLMVDASLISRTTHNRALSIIKSHMKGKPVDKVELAHAFWQCTNFAFSNKIGGGYKYSNNQDTVVPDTLAIKKREFTTDLVRRIEHAYIENTDFLKVLQSRNTKDAFHYLDPPYFNADMGHYKGFLEEDYKRLLQWCEEECKGKFLQSSYDSKILRQYIKRNDWRFQEITKRIQASAHRRKNGDVKTEMLVWNYDENEGQLKMFQ